MAMTHFFFMSFAGINVRALEEFFAIATEEGCDNEWKISVSMMEIYNESVNDLLLPSKCTMYGRSTMRGPPRPLCFAVIKACPHTSLQTIPN